MRLQSVSVHVWCVGEGARGYVLSSRGWLVDTETAFSTLSAQPPTTSG